MQDVSAATTPNTALTETSYNSQFAKALRKKLELLEQDHLQLYKAYIAAKHELEVKFEGGVNYGRIYSVL